MGLDNSDFNEELLEMNSSANNEKLNLLKMENSDLYNQLMNKLDYIRDGNESHLTGNTNSKSNNNNLNSPVVSDERPSTKQQMSKMSGASYHSCTNSRLESPKIKKEMKAGNYDLPL